MRLLCIVNNVSTIQWDNYKECMAHFTVFASKNLRFQNTDIFRSDQTFHHFVLLT